MAALDDNDASFLGGILEAIFWGIYVVVFVLYLNFHRKSTGGLLVYPLSALFILCTAFVTLDFALEFLTILHSADPNSEVISNRLTVGTSMIYVLVDFISQGVLIYRCWVVWGKNPLLIIFPSILSLTSFEQAANIPLIIMEVRLIPGHRTAPQWFIKLGSASIILSLTVNILITGILVLKLVIHRREHEKGLNGRHGGGLNLSSLISFLIESAMLTFASQLIWVVLFNLQDTNNGVDAFDGVVTLSCGIAPTAVIVRVAMGKSFDNRPSGVVESTIDFRTPRNNSSSITAAASTSKISNLSPIDEVEKGTY
ncbi:hypothetical protein GALMADRAFT_146563 [Galerina marginata CBS 339.88]|uniref:G-protein coupled receptors family 1 profile domain-containing protein n=1 Tax=Galerina marginata (strain CBS 339.88) TaxID=685588 RepID=A0A067SAX3_GALM3|nr:hypothetical protein GALMADRAFT_146563 [Galerina marginata CBS 339.88]